MNIPYFEITGSSPTLEASSPHVRETNLYRIGPMATIKLFMTMTFVASALVLSHEEQWRLLGGLLIGCVAGGLGGMLMVALKATRMPWEIYAWRFAMNLCFGVGLGAPGTLFLSWKYDVNPGPLLTIGVGFICACFGVAVATALTPLIMRRLRRMAGEDRESGVLNKREADDMDHRLGKLRPKPEPPTVKLPTE